MTQTMPERTARRLKHMYAIGHPLLNATLAHAITQGWRPGNLGAVIGITRQAVARRATNSAGPYVSIPAPDDRRPYELDDNEIQALRDLRSRARRVAGLTPEDDPARIAGKELAARLDAHIRDGVPVSYLAGILDVTARAIKARLERAGYRTPAPSTTRRKKPTP